MSDDKWSGEGFSREPFTPEENAKFRHMRHVMGTEWVSLGNVSTVFRSVSIIGTAISKGWPVIVGAGAFGVWAKSQGWI